jgi:hypothetical protein
VRNPGVRNPGQKSVSEIRKSGNPGRKSGSENWLGNPGRTRSEIRDQNPGEKSGSGSEMPVGED